MAVTRGSVPDRYREFVNLSPLFGLEPITIDRGAGAILWDDEGRQYVDCFAGIAVVNAGHCDPRVVKAAQLQMERLVHCGSYLYHVAVVAELAENIARVAVGRLTKTFFCNSGAEAIEGALRLARSFTGRHEFIALEAGFHGRTNATLSVTGNRKRKQHGGPYLGGVAFAPAPYPLRCRLCHGKCTLACADAVADVIEYQTSGDVAAFIAEPVLGEGGIIVPHDDYFARVKAILDRHGILLVADEVQSGFGRTGKMFAMEHFGVEPDIMAMAKGIADGFPLAGFIARPEVAESFQPGEHMSTFGGNPVACAAGLASLKAIEEDGLVEHSAKLGDWLLRQLAGFQRFSTVGEIRGKGLMVGVELVTDRSTNTANPELAKLIRSACRERGVLIGVGGFNGNVLRLQPPLVIDQAQLGLVLEVLDEAFSEAGADFKGRDAE